MSTTGLQQKVTQTSNANLSSLVVVVVVVVELLYYAKRIIIVTGADLSEFCSLIFVCKFVFLFHVQ